MPRRPKGPGPEGPGRGHAVSARKRLVITPSAEGAANRCVMENRSLMSQEVFDWLDDTFR